MNPPCAGRRRRAALRAGTRRFRAHSGRSATLVFGRAAPDLHSARPRPITADTRALSEHNPRGERKRDGGEEGGGSRGGSHAEHRPPRTCSPGHAEIVYVLRGERAAPRARTAPGSGTRATAPPRMRAAGAVARPPRVEGLWVNVLLSPSFFFFTWNRGLFRDDLWNSRALNLLFSD